MPLLCIYPREIKIYVHTKVWMQMFRAALCTVAKKVDIAQMSINQWKDIHRMDNFSNEKEWSTDTGYNMDEPQKCAQWKKPDTKGHLLYDAIYMKKNAKRQIYRERKKISSCLGLEVKIGSD